MTETTETTAHAVAPVADTLSEQPSVEAISYLRCVVYGDKETLATLVRGADTYVEQINRAFLENPAVGDIVLEPTDNGYKLVDDYRSEVEEWIQSL